MVYAGVEKSCFILVIKLCNTLKIASEENPPIKARILLLNKLIPLAAVYKEMISERIIPAITPKNIKAV